MKVQWRKEDEQLVLAALARVIYERDTQKDWHTAPVDPGVDPHWLAKAQRHQDARQRDRNP
jgi:hypothetical protein